MDTLLGLTKATQADLSMARLVFFDSILNVWLRLY